MDMLFENTQFSNKLIFIIGDIDYVINNDLPERVYVDFSNLFNSRKIY